MATAHNTMTVEIGNHEARLRDDMTHIVGESVYECVNCENQALDSFDLKSLNCE